jgi:hypothetical protein
MMMMIKGNECKRGTCQVLRVNRKGGGKRKGTEG